MLPRVQWSDYRQYQKTLNLLNLMDIFVAGLRSHLYRTRTIWRKKCGTMVNHGPDTDAAYTWVTPTFARANSDLA
jgi:hypothetical protein